MRDTRLSRRGSWTWPPRDGLSELSQGRPHQGERITLGEVALMSKGSSWDITYLWPSAGSTSSSGGSECLGPEGQCGQCIKAFPTGANAQNWTKVAQRILRREVAQLHWGSKEQKESLSGVLMSLCWALSFNVQIRGREYLDRSTASHTHLLARMGGIFD